MMVANQVIPFVATAAGRAARIKLDGGMHEHSFPVGGGLSWLWRSVGWDRHTDLCDTSRCWRLRLKAGTLREVVESEA